MAYKQEESVNGFLKGAELFSVDFHKKVASKVEGNFVGSALSAHAVLAMTAYGADGTTAKTMRKCLRLPENDGQAHEAFQEFIDTINNVEDAVLKIANKIYASADVSVKDKFKQITGTFFRSVSDTLNFVENIESAGVINSWCSEKTNGKITEIISADDLNCTTSMILLNAVYFKANWKYQFNEKYTTPEVFHVDKSTTIEVPMMHVKETLSYRKLKAVNANCIALPYLNEDLYMLIIVPNKIDGLAKIERNLHKIELKEEDFKADKQEIILSLPKFKIKSTLDLNDPLNEMGLAEIFTEKANFNNICDKQLRVSKILQKSFIEVNEEGSEAAVVTAINSIRRCAIVESPPFHMKVDRPFLFKIVLKNYTLFSGRINNPNI